MDVCQSGYIFLNSDLITFLYNCYCFFFKTVLFIQGCQPLIEESVKQRFKEVSALLFALASVVVNNAKLKIIQNPCNGSVETHILNYT